MNNDPKPLPCPFCSQELVERDDAFGMCWKHPFHPATCIAYGIVLGDSGDIAEWNHRPAEMKLAQAVTALEHIEGFTENSYDPNVSPIWEAARDALAKIRP